MSARARLAVATLCLVVGAGMATTPASASLPSERGSGFHPKSARVPSLCGFPAGRLMNGSLPIAGEEGAVTLHESSKARASGVLRRQRGRSHVLTLRCGRGYHYEQQHVLVYSRSGRVVKKFPLSRFFAGGDVLDVRRASIRKKKLTVEVTHVEQEGDAYFNEIAAGLLQIKWKRSGPKVVRKRVYTERPAARAFVAAIVAGDRGRALRHGSPHVVDQALGLRQPNLVMEYRGCIGPYSPGWPTHVSTSYGRMCTLVTYDPETGNGSGYGLFMGKSSWRTFKVRQLEDIAG